MTKKNPVYKCMRRNQPDKSVRMTEDRKGVGGRENERFTAEKREIWFLSTKSHTRAIHIRRHTAGHMLCPTCVAVKSSKQLQRPSGNYRTDTIQRMRARGTRKHITDQTSANISWFHVAVNINNRQANTRHTNTHDTTHTSPMMTTGTEALNEFISSPFALECGDSGVRRQQKTQQLSMPWREKRTKTTSRVFFHFFFYFGFGLSPPRFTK